MAKVKVLIEGYARQIKGGWLASSTATLIENKEIKIIVDPGINRELLLKKLKEQGLKLADIDVVFMTHYHPDHNLLVGIFPKAIVIDDELIYERDKQTRHKRMIPGTKIKIIPTPGHEQFHASLIAPTDKGIIIIAGDVFWWADEERQDTSNIKILLGHEDPFVKDKKALKENRQKLLKIADWIIPGHGKMFSNPKRIVT